MNKSGMNNTCCALQPLLVFPLQYSCHCLCLSLPILDIISFSVLWFIQNTWYYLVTLGGFTL